MPEVLYEDIIEVDERVVLYQKDCQLNLDSNTVQGRTGEQVWSNVSICFSFLYFIVLQLHILTELNSDQLTHDLELVFAKGIKSLAVVLMHSYT